MKYGYGSFEQADRRQSKEELRNVFLRAVKCHAKKVLVDLSEESLSAYRKAGLHFDANAHEANLKHLPDEERAKQISSLRYKRDRPDWLNNFESAPIDYDPYLAALRESLFSWSSRNRLDAAWCRACAYETLEQWCAFPYTHERLQWRPSVTMWEVFGLHPDDTRFTFTHEIAHPQLTPLDKSEAEIRKVFERELKAFLMEFRDAANEQEFVLTPETYKSKYAVDRFRWLVEFKINEKEYPKIVHADSLKYKGGGADYSTIRKAVIKLADEIELPLRSEKI